MIRLTSLITAVVIFLMMLGAFIFINYEVRRSIAAIATARVDIVKEEARGADAQITKEFLDRTVAERTQVETYFIGVDGTADALSLVEQLARASKVEARVTAADITRTASAFHEELTVSLAIRGEFNNVLNLVTMLESLPRASYVRNVALEASAGGTWSGSVVVVFIKSRAL